MERHFEQALAELRSNLVAMGNLVDRQISAACNALFEGDSARARQAMQTDVIFLVDAKMVKHNTFLEESGS